MADTEMFFNFENYPAGVDDGLLKEHVAFGHYSDSFVVLIEVEPDKAGGISIIVGNGPPHTDAPKAVGAALHSIAEMVEELANKDEYWEAIKKLDSQ